MPPDHCVSYSASELSLEGFGKAVMNHRCCCGDGTSRILGQPRAPLADSTFREDAFDICGGLRKRKNSDG